MDAVQLTEGAISSLSSPDTDKASLKPVLQVYDVRPVSPQNHNSERYRLMLSDGEFLQQGMLATQRNEMVKSNMLMKGSIVRLMQFVCNVVQNRRIIIIIDLEVLVRECEIIGQPKTYPFMADGTPHVAKPPARTQLINQPANPAESSFSVSSPRPTMGAGPAVAHFQQSGEDYNSGSHSYSSSFSGNMNSGRYNPSNASAIYPKPEVDSGIPRAHMNNYARPPSSLYQQPSPMFANRGPIAKNEAPPRIIPIAALNPYQGRWTIKARVTAKSELRLYNNPRGDGKVFSFDLLDSDGGEIRVTCFNAVADQFYHQIESGKVYMISRGTLKAAQKAFNHLRNDYEIMLDNTSTVQPCYEDDKSIPQQQFHFRPISDIEGLDNNSILDLIAIVSSINPPSSIMRKNGTETQKRTLQLKDMSGRSVELTLWGNFCNAEGQTLQTMCDSGQFPVLAVKSCRVNDFNGKSVGTISSSQLFIEPDFPELQRLKTWFNSNGKNTPAIPLSREAGTARTDVRKTISQIKDEKLGTSEKPDWITVSATLIYIKVDNFSYTACPIMIGDRQCNKKVTNNGDGKWRCERCDQSVDECDYRYILQMQIQDHTGITWVTAFQESGEEIMGRSAKELYYMKHEEQDEEKFSEVLRDILFTKFMFKLKVKEETFSDEQRVKSTVVKAEKVNFQTEAKYLLDLAAKSKNEDLGSLPPKSEGMSASGLTTVGFGGSGEPATAAAMNYSGVTNNVAREGGASMSQSGNQYGGSRYPSTGIYTSCGSCGSSGHSSANCPSLMTAPGQSYGTGLGSRATLGDNGVGASGGASGECFKCHQTGHWARDCPGVSNAPPAYGTYNANSVSGAGGGASGECFKCHQTGHWARDCPGVGNAPAYGTNNANTGRYGMAPKQYVGGF
ncbi:replication protein A 70 kDa DNA-binding subunit A-like [Salvia miltiorrhiza]|uniref:replication protein A 70 kDa DNA-binding subunit A-like n=1 Tax=Salvia miltiorrhiza TaxID=226208 RepID=UPI0025AC0F47|nr:replication protein A 70 kDa DNA-binding subunit A-like [Salvia miltiorrhiza]